MLRKYAYAHPYAHCARRSRGYVQCAALHPSSEVRHDVGRSERLRVLRRYLGTFVLYSGMYECSLKYWYVNIKQYKKFVLQSYIAQPIIESEIKYIQKVFYISYSLERIEDLSKQFFPHKYFQSRPWKKLRISELTIFLFKK